MPNRKGFFRRVASGVSVVKKDFGVTAVGSAGWSVVSGSGGGTRYPGSDMNWDAEAGELWLNSVVALCLQYIFDKITEPKVRAVSQGADDQLKPISSHPATLLIDWANPEYRCRQLAAALALSYKLNGNAYAVKVRGSGGLGQPRELWYVPHWQMRPVAPPDNGPTEFYERRWPAAGGYKTKLYSRADVIHFRNGLDPGNNRVGMSPFRSLLRGVVSDNEIDTYTAVLLRNMGVFGAILTADSGPDKPFDITPTQAEQIKDKLRENGTGDSRGSVSILPFPLKVDFTSRSPQDLALDKIGDRPQQRICSAFGVDPAAIGLLSSAGGGEKYGALRKEARAQSFEQGIVPMLAVFAEGWTQELLPDFMPGQQQPGVMPAAPPVWIEYDYSKVKDLQEDSDAIHLRAQGDFKNYITKVDEARAAIGLPPDPENGDKYLWELVQPQGITPVGGDPLNPDDPGNVPPKKPVKPGRPTVPDEDDEDPQEKSYPRFKGWVTHEGHHIFIDDDGEVESGGHTGEQAPSASTKSMLAKQSAKYVGADIQRYSEEHNEPILAKGVSVGGSKGLSLRDNEPVDVIVTKGGQITGGIELKTMVDNKANKITMKASAMQRKAAWSEENHAPYHTVVFDDHGAYNAGGKGKHDDSKRQIYYKRGFGSFRITAMHKVKDMGELNSLLGMADHELPDAAKPPKNYTSPVK